MNETDPFHSRSEKGIFFEALGMNAKIRKTGVNKEKGRHYDRNQALPKPGGTFACGLVSSRSSCPFLLGISYVLLNGSIGPFTTMKF
jgi:hypothetical protein